MNTFENAYPEGITASDVQEAAEAYSKGTSMPEAAEAAGLSTQEFKAVRKVHRLRKSSAEVAGVDYVLPIDRANMVSDQGKEIHESFDVEVEEEEGEEYDPRMEGASESEEKASRGEFTWATSEDYEYNEATDDYIFYLDSYPQAPYVVSGEKVRKMVRAYSDYDGDPATINQIAVQNELPRQIWHEMKTALGLTHDSPPRTDEEFELLDEDEMVEEDLFAKKHSYHKKLQTAAFRQQEKDAEKWREREYYTKEIIDAAVEEMNREAYEVPRLEQDTDLPTAALVANIQDSHIGAQYAYGGATLEEQTERVRSAFARLLTRSSSSSSPEKVYIVAGADLLHCDTEGSTTTKGTQLQTCAPTSQILKSAVALLVDMVDMALQVAEVELVYVAGNHDRVLGYAAFLAVRQAFSQADDFTAKESSADRQYRSWADHALVFTHGEMTKRQMKKLPRIALSESRQIIAGADWVSVFTGHFHEEAITIDDAGFKTFRCPTSKPTDSYEEREGYVGGREGLQGVLLFEGGDDQTLSVRTGT